MMTEDQKQGMKEQIRETFMRNGFTIKDGQSDLKDYVYSAAYELIAALTQPASPALKLPDEAKADSSDGDDVTAWIDEGWNACLAEVKRLNAPHTAHIEPSCATGRTMPLSEFNELVGKLAARNYGNSVDIADVLCAFNIKPERPE